MGDQIIHRFSLPKQVPIYIGRQEFVIDYAKGKDVLHLGCVDEGMLELKQQRGVWLHERIIQVANSVWGVDIDQAGLELMRAQGYTHLFYADIENLTAVPEIFQKDFNLILLAEVLEHLDNPGRFLQNIHPLFNSTTEMLVTVPNSTSLGNILENLRGVELVHPDHNYWFSLHTLQALFWKFGYDAACVGVYCQYNYRRSITGHFWNRIKRLLGSSSPQAFSSSPAHSSPPIRKQASPNLIGWIKAVLTASLYRLILTRRPFFADGLIVIVKPLPPEKVNQNLPTESTHDISDESPLISLGNQ